MVLVARNFSEKSLKNHPIQSLQQSKDVLVIWGKINCKRSFKKLQLCEGGSSFQQKKNKNSNILLLKSFNFNKISPSETTEFDGRYLA